MLYLYDLPSKLGMPPVVEAHHNQVLNVDLGHLSILSPQLLAKEPVIVVDLGHSNSNQATVMSFVFEILVYLLESVCIFRCSSQVSGNTSRIGCSGLIPIVLNLLKKISLPVEDEGKSPYFGSEERKNVILLTVVKQTGVGSLVHVRLVNVTIVKIQAHS